MTSDERWAAGAAMVEDVYQGMVPVLPKGAMAFTDLMTEDVFGGVWTRPGLEVRDRRLIIMGVIAAVGGTATWKIQCKAGLRRGDFTEDEVREVLVQAMYYVGLPRAAEFTGVTEEAIAEHRREQAEAAAGEEG